MQIDKKPKKRRNSARTFIFDKRFCAVATTIAAVSCGLAYFRGDLPILNLSSVSSHQTQRNLPNGSIIIPYGNGLCRLRAIDSETGQIRDDGTVDCLDAADENSATWKSFVEQQKANEIRKSFRND